MRGEPMQRKVGLDRSSWVKLFPGASHPIIHIISYHMYGPDKNDVCFDNRVAREIMLLHELDHLVYYYSRIYIQYIS